MVLIFFGYDWTSFQSVNYLYEREIHLLIRVRVALSR